MQLLDRARRAGDEARRRLPLLDRLVRARAHAGAVGADQQAGAVTYYGFLSVFPVLALSFFGVGLISRWFPDAQGTMAEAIDGVLPGLLGEGEGRISLAQIERAADAVGLLGLGGVLYAGLGWLTSLRQALAVVFERPADRRAGFLAGKLRDLAALLGIGAILLVSVVMTGALRASSAWLLDRLGLDGLGWLLTLLTVVLGLAANWALFLAMFRLPAGVELAGRDAVAGALLGALGFEALKQVSGLLLDLTRDSPAFQLFGIALILVVWIHYFSKVTLFAAAFAHVGAKDGSGVAAHRIAAGRV